MISLETQNRQKFIGKLELNLEKSPEKEPEKKNLKKTKTKRNKKIEISDLKNFPCNFAPANFCRSWYQIQYSMVQ